MEVETHTPTHSLYYSLNHSLPPSPEPFGCVHVMCGACRHGESPRVYSHAAQSIAAIILRMQSFQEFSFLSRLCEFLWNFSLSGYGFVNVTVSQKSFLLQCYFSLYVHFSSFVCTVRRCQRRNYDYYLVMVLNSKS